jgi:ubiquinone biosynthesis protein UbiJ
MPEVKLGSFGEASIAATVFALVDRAASHRPEVVAELEGKVVTLCLGAAYHPVRVRFGRDEVIVDDDVDGVADLVVRGTLPDLQTLLTAPLTKGVPRSRAALARLADGRVQLDGPTAVGRRLLRLLSVP